ncbi:hypothetical protein QJS66_01130 [Kocuria rhizophila]|nr:hypothetical protein QJS66_01130 [Kocuria rhizophila]
MAAARHWASSRAPSDGQRSADIPPPAATVVGGRRRPRHFAPRRPTAPPCGSRLPRRSRPVTSSTAAGRWSMVTYATVEISIPARPVSVSRLTSRRDALLPARARVTGRSSSAAPGPSRRLPGAGRFNPLPEKA